MLLPSHRRQHAQEGQDQRGQAGGGQGRFVGVRREGPAGGQRQQQRHAEGQEAAQLARGRGHGRSGHREHDHRQRGALQLAHGREPAQRQYHQHPIDGQQRGDASGLRCRGCRADKACRQPDAPGCHGADQGPPQPGQRGGLAVRPDQGHQATRSEDAPLGARAVLEEDVDEAGLDEGAQLGRVGLGGAIGSARRVDTCRCRRRPRRRRDGCRLTHALPPFGCAVSWGLALLSTGILAAGSARADGAIPDAGAAGPGAARARLRPAVRRARGSRTRRAARAGRPRRRRRRRAARRPRARARRAAGR